ncbi:hypothetical protein AX14_010166 [Amanita brunnescens Koide BX004]|nr:hypothetical protein AX14_010166 [Amanita brunnescens Koide BX004]
MLPKIILTAIVAVLQAFLVSADVTPTDPGPNTVFNAGSNCNIDWLGDTSSTTAWQNMSIQFMTGSNFDMIPLTTVVENLDGTQSGSYSWTCPQVTPPAPIYFYQFTAPNTADKQWTARFTIATSSGQTVPAPDATQPGSGEQIPWGAGGLSNPSSAVPPPAYLGNGTTSSSSTSSSSTSSSGNSSSSSTPTVLSSSLPGTSPVATNVGPPVSSASGFTTVVVTTSAHSPTAPASTSSNGATPYTPFMHNWVLSICGLIITVLF